MGRPKIKYKITQKLVGYPKNTITGFLDVDGDGEVAVLPAGHVEVRLRLGPQRGKLACHVHLGDELSVHIVVTRRCHGPHAAAMRADLGPSRAADALERRHLVIVEAIHERRWPLILLVVLHSWL